MIGFFGGNNLVNNADKACLIYNKTGTASTIDIPGIGGENVTSKNSEKLLGLHVSTPVGNKCWIFSMSMGFREHGALVYTHDYPPELLKHSPEASRRNGSLQQQGVGGRHLGPPGTIF